MVMGMRQTSHHTPSCIPQRNHMPILDSFWTLITIKWFSENVKSGSFGSTFGDFQYKQPFVCCQCRIITQWIWISYRLRRNFEEKVDTWWWMLLTVEVQAALELLKFSWFAWFWFLRYVLSIHHDLEPTKNTGTCTSVIFFFTRILTARLTKNWSLTSIVEEIRNMVFWNLNCSLSSMGVDARAIMRVFYMV